MKTFTYQQAIKELNRIFGSYTITDKVDTITNLEIYFTTRDGKKLVLLANGWEVFQKVTKYVINEA